MLLNVVISASAGSTIRLGQMKQTLVSTLLDLEVLFLDQAVVLPHPLVLRH
jgi:hypothetical protein